MSKIGIVIGREFNERVRKKSFIISTILMPILMVALMVAPTLIMVYGKSDVKKIIVVDQSQLFAQALTDSEEVDFEFTDKTLDEARADKEGFGVLHIGEDILTNNSNITLYTNSASSFTIEESISSKVKSEIENKRLKENYDIENLDQMLEEVKATVHLKSVRDDMSGDGESQSSIVSMAAGYVLGFILYMFLLIYGSMVMTSVIEEKSSRVLEVLVSSVKPFDLLLGKIISIAMVALTQIVIWGVLLLVISVAVIPAVLPDDVMSSVAMMQTSGATGMDMAASSGIDAEMITALSALTDVGYISQMLGYMIIFLMGGYLLYSAMFAAVGAAVDTVEDSQNLQLPVTMPIMLAIFVMMMVAKDPNSPLITTFSMIPFTSPIIMMARIPHGIPTWEIVVSLVILFSTFLAMVWIAAKIYRVGIFVHGKKPTFKELYKWIKQS